MIITKIILENYGLYPGIQQINLTPKNSKKNIILVGGTNGYGKTTLFHGILLCFYGPNFRDTPFKTKKEYREFLNSMIHYNIKKDYFPTKSSIEVSFTHENLSFSDNYSIKRSWRNDNDKIIETFIVKKNGVLLDDVSAENWQDFINDLIPRGLSQLFFFDGEKIQNLVKDDHGNKEFSSSFKMLLGIDLIEKLMSDLKLYSYNQLKKIGAKQIREEILSLGSQFRAHLKSCHPIRWFFQRRVVRHGQI